MTDPKGRIEPGFEKHVFICGHERNSIASRPHCVGRGSFDVLSSLKSMAREHMLSNIRIQKSGCLDFCEHGISCVVYPEGSWFSLHRDADLIKFIEYLKTGKGADSLAMKFE